MKNWRVVLGLACLGACASPPAPAPPVAASALPAPEPLASSAYTPVPPPPPPPRFQLTEPFALVARAAPDAELHVMPDPAGALVLAVSPGGETHFALVEGDKVRAMPELSSQFPGLSPTGRVEIQRVVREKVGSPWWAQIGHMQDGPRVEFLRFGPGGWSFVDQFLFGESGEMVLAEPQGEQLFFISHAVAGMTPVLQSAGQERKNLPQFSAATHHPHSCKSLMSSVMAFRVWSSGEMLALGTSCWIPALQIERWGPKQQRSAAQTIKAVTLQDPSRATLVSPDEMILDWVSLEGTDDHLFRVRIVRTSDVWKIRDRTPVIFPDPRIQDASARLEKLDAQLLERWPVGDELYLEAVFPAQGAPSERLLLRYSPIKEPIEF